jgi:hypothetical protein
MLELIYGQQRSPKPPPNGDGDGEELHTLEEHLKGKSDRIKELFGALREGIAHRRNAADYPAYPSHLFEFLIPDSDIYAAA